jgi:hypothetical protein
MAVKRLVSHVAACVCPDLISAQKSVLLRFHRPGEQSKQLVGTQVVEP